MKRLKYILFLLSVLHLYNCIGQIENAQEKIFLHLNRYSFVAGETVFLKAYNLNKDKHLPSAQSKIIYIELRDINTNKITTTRFYTVDGVCDGHIKLPDTIATGCYFLIVATDRMKNYVRNYFSTPLLIISQTDEKVDSIKIPENSQLTKIYTDSTMTVPVEASCKIISDKVIYHPRDKAQINIQMKDANGKPIKANLSMSVTEINPLNRLEQDICLFSKDNLTLVEEKIPQSRFLLENKGYILTGKVIDKNTGKGVPQICVLLSILDSITDLNNCYTNSEGFFYFLMDKFSDNKYASVKIYGANDRLNDLKIVIDDKSIKMQKKACQTIAIDSALKVMLMESKKLAMINKIYDIDFLKYHIPQPPMIVRQYPNFFSMHEYTINPEEYTDITDFEELAINKLLPNVKVRKKYDNYSIHMFDELFGNYWEYNPLIVLNNVIVNDMNFIAKMETRKIKKIEINTKHIIYGDMDIYGVISISTKQPTPTTDETNETSVIFANKTSENNTDFYAPDYSIKGINKSPDFRQTLYWNPNIHIDSAGSEDIYFYTSDLFGKYKINIQGITESGQPVSANTIIEVK